MIIIAVDWSKDVRKRSAYQADVSTRIVSRLALDGNLAQLVEYANSLDRGVLIGIDAAIGMPSADWERLTGGERDPGCTFVDHLLKGRLPVRFFDPVATPEQWSPARPFIRPAAGPWSMTAFIEASRGGFYRQIDRRLNGNPIFVTSGIPGSVGSGTRALWLELLAMGEKPACSIWPFHGALDHLIRAGRPVIAEIYPKVCYGIVLSDSLPCPLMSIAKTRQHAREDALARLMQTDWLETHKVQIQDAEPAIANEDDFDALVSAAALLRLVMDKAPVESLVPQGLTVEGGVLGSASIAESRRRTGHPRHQDPPKTVDDRSGCARE